MCIENFDPCFPDQPVVDLYLPGWASQGAFCSKPAFIWAEDGGERRCLSYGQLNFSADCIASRLLGGQELRRGDTVLVVCFPGLEFVKILFSCQRAGLLCVPVSPPESSTVDHLVRVLLQTRPQAVIANRALAESISRSATSSSNGARGQLSRLLSKLRGFSVEDLMSGAGGDAGDVNYSNGDDSINDSRKAYTGCAAGDVYLIQYTSGTTGIPKPVLVTAGAAAHNVRAARKAYKLQPNTIFVTWLPQFHDCGLMFLLLTIVSGATCVVTSPANFVNRPRFWLELITEFEATCTPVPSFALPLVVRRGGISYGSLPLKLGSLRNLVLINEPIYRALVDEFLGEFACMGLLPSCISPSYGLAENCTFVSTAWRQNGEFCIGFPDIPSYKNLLPSARLASLPDELGEDETEEMDIVVVDADTGEPVADGIEGEIWVCSPSNASGYVGYPSLTRERFQGRVMGGTSRNHVKTGDMGVVHGDERYLYVMGCASDMINPFGRSQGYHPHFLERAAYESCPQRLRGGCIAAFEISSVMMMVAEVQRGQDCGAEAGRCICQAINEGLVKHDPKIDQLVRLVVLVKCGSLPKTTSGKMQRWAAKAKMLRNQLPVVEAELFVPPSTGSSDGPERDGKRVLKSLCSWPDAGLFPLHPMSCL